MNEMLKIDCADWREISEDHLDEAVFIAEMLIEAEEELCMDEAA